MIFTSFIRIGLKDIFLIFLFFTKQMFGLRGQQVIEHKSSKAKFCLCWLYALLKPQYVLWASGINETAVKSHQVNLLIIL
jgi:uncharacterized membrane protein YsdA (DUF1294 family)